MFKLCQTCKFIDMNCWLGDENIKFTKPDANGKCEIIKCTMYKEKLEHYINEIIEEHKE